jgi:hypothetical protein
VIPDRVLKVVWGVATLGVVGVALTVSLDKPWVSPLPPKDASADAPAGSAIAEAGSPPEPVIDVDASLPSTPSLTLDLIGASDASTRHVKVGVVLVQFAGAQGALPTARPKANALELARKLADDSGSADDIGRIGRGILEPQVEGVVFGMTPGQTSEPIETPRGYWVVKRLE